MYTLLINIEQESNEGGVGKWLPALPDWLRPALYRREADKELLFYEEKLVVSRADEQSDNYWLNRLRNWRDIATDPQIDQIILVARYREGDGTGVDLVRKCWDSFVWPLLSEFSWHPYFGFPLRVRILTIGDVPNQDIEEKGRSDKKIDELTEKLLAQFDDNIKQLQREHNTGTSSNNNADEINRVVHDFDLALRKELRLPEDSDLFGPNGVLGQESAHGNIEVFFKERIRKCVQHAEGLPGLEWRWASDLGERLNENKVRVEVLHIDQQQNQKLIDKQVCLKDKQIFFFCYYVISMFLSDKRAIPNLTIIESHGRKQSIDLCAGRLQIVVDPNDEDKVCKEIEGYLSRLKAIQSELANRAFYTTKDREAPEQDKQESKHDEDLCDQSRKWMNFLKQWKCKRDLLVEFEGKFNNCYFVPLSKSDEERTKYEWEVCFARLLEKPINEVTVKPIDQVRSYTRDRLEQLCKWISWRQTFFKALLLSGMAILLAYMPGMMTLYSIDGLPLVFAPLFVLAVFACVILIVRYRWVNIQQQLERVFKDCEDEQHKLDNRKVQEQKLKLLEHLIGRHSGKGVASSSIQPALVNYYKVFVDKHIDNIIQKDAFPQFKNTENNSDSNIPNTINKWLGKSKPEKSEVSALFFLGHATDYEVRVFNESKRFSIDLPGLKEIKALRLGATKP